MLTKNSENVQLDQESGLKYLFYDPTPEYGPSYRLLIWKPRSRKPDYYRYRTAEDRLSAFERYKANYLRHKQQIAERRVYSTVTPEIMAKINIGDIFVCSWGYDQTNYDYICVVEKKAKTVICQRTAHKHLGVSDYRNIQKPILAPFGDRFPMRVKKGYGDFYLTGSYPHCHTGMGSRRRDDFTKVCKGDTFHETDAMYGR